MEGKEIFDSIVSAVKKNIMEDSISIDDVRSEVEDTINDALSDAKSIQDVQKEAINAVEYNMNNYYDKLEVSENAYEILGEYISDSVWNNYRDVVSKADLDIFSEKESKKIINDVLMETDDFSDDICNIIYLKLLNIYNNRTDKREEQELYYIIDRFSPTKSTSMVIKNLKNEIESALDDKKFKEVLDNANVYDDAMRPYIETNKYAQKVKDDSEAVRITKDIIGRNIRVHNKEYMEGNLDKQELVDKLTINLGDDELAKMYCKAFGMRLTKEEKDVLKRELSKKELNIISKVL